MKTKNFIVYDIETLNVNFSDKDDYGVPNWTGKEKIFSIAYIDNNGEKECLIVDDKSFKTEKELLEAFCKICKDYEFIFGYNSDKFDNPLMTDRLRRLDLRKYQNLFHFGFNTKNLDVMKIAKLLHYGEDGLSLNALAKELGLREQKEDVNPIIAYKQKDYDSLRKYNIKDVELTKDCLLKMDGLNMVQKLVDLTGCKHNQVFSATKMLNSYINSKDYLVEQIQPDKQRGHNKGGYNYYEDSNELQRYDDLTHFDVVSMYPSIMILIGADNTYDYPSFNIDKQEPFKFTKEEVERNGVISIVAKELFSERIKTKGIMDGKDPQSGEYISLDHEQQAYKILVNSLYGALDVKSYDMFPLKNSKLASLITSIGRNLLKACIERFGGVYGKTDSIWVPKGITEEDVNSFVDEYLKEYYNLNNKSDDERIIRFEKESDLKTLIVKSKNEYIEILENGDVNIKGGAFKGNNVSRFETDLINKYVIKGEPLNDLDDFVKEACKGNDLKYFSIYVKLSENQLHQKRFNTSWMEKNNIPYELGFKYWSVYSEAGYLVFDDRVPKIPVSEKYAYYLAYNRLYTVKMSKEKPKKIFEDYVPLIPVVPKKDNKGYRYAPAIKEIAKYLDIDNIPKGGLGHKFYVKYNLSNIKSNYYGLLCHKETGYFALDIDKNVGEWYDKLSKKLSTKSNYWQTTRSNNYHIILKTKDLDIFDLKWTNEDIEFKTNAIVPVNIIKKGGTYKKLKESPDLKDLKNIGFGRFVKIIIELNLSDGKTKKHRPLILKKEEFIVDMPMTVLDGVVDWTEELWGTLNSNETIREQVSSNNLMIAIGNLFKSQLTLEDCEYVVNKLYDNGKIEKDLLNKINSITFNGEDSYLKLSSCGKGDIMLGSSDKGDEEEVTYNIPKLLDEWEHKFYTLVSVKYRKIFGNGELDWEKILKENLLDYAHDYKPLIYHFCNILNIRINKQYRIIILSDDAKKGKTFVVILFREFTPKDMVKISEEYQSFTLSAFRQFCNIFKKAFDRVFMFVTDVASGASEDWENILEELKGVISGDVKSGNYRHGKSKQGGKGIQFDTIYSKNGFIMYIANAAGFDTNDQVKRRSSQLRLKSKPEEYTIKRVKEELNFQQIPDFEEKKDVFIDKVMKYLCSFDNVTKQEIVELKRKIPDNHIRFLMQNTNAEDYYAYLYTCFLLLHNIKEPTDKAFSDFCKICQVNEYSNLFGNQLNMLKLIKEWAIPVGPESLKGLTDMEILEKVKNNPFKQKKQGFKYFTAANIKKINNKKVALENTTEAELLEKLAKEGHIRRACKNQKDNWVYYLPKKE